MMKLLPQMSKGQHNSAAPGPSEFFIPGFVHWMPDMTPLTKVWHKLSLYRRDISLLLLQLPSKHIYRN